MDEDECCLMLLDTIEQVWVLLSVDVALCGQRWQQYDSNLGVVGDVVMQWLDAISCCITPMGVVGCCWMLVDVATHLAAGSEDSKVRVYDTGTVGCCHSSGHSMQHPTAFHHVALIKCTRQQHDNNRVSSMQCTMPRKLAVVGWCWVLLNVVWCCWALLGVVSCWMLLVAVGYCCVFL